jgi:hypothetical protein
MMHCGNNLKIILLLLTASRYLPGGSGTTLHNTIQYYTIHKITHTDTQNNTQQKLQTP